MAKTSSLLSPGIAVNENDQSYIAPGPVQASMALIGPTVKGSILNPTIVNSYDEYVRIFGETFETETYSGSTGKIQQEYLTSIAANFFFNHEGDSLLVTRVAPPEQFTPATSSTVTGSTYTGSLFTLYTLGAGAIMNSLSGSTYATESNSDGVLDKGTADNIRFSIEGVNVYDGTFNVIVRRGDDTNSNPIVLEKFTNVSLDPLNTNYIAAAIGDQYTVFVPESSEQGTARVETRGYYPNKSKYVRINTSTIHNLKNYTSSSSGSLPAEGTAGAFSGATGTVGACWDGTREVTGSVEGCDYFENLKATSIYPQSVPTGSYVDAISLMSNPEEYKVKVIAVPGILNIAVLTALKTAIDARSQEGGGGSLGVIDLVPFGQTAQEAANATSFDSSRLVTYWPWIQMTSATGKNVWCPASTAILGVYAFADQQSAPWYVPAGMSRGTLNGVVQVEKKLTKEMRNIVYVRNINPIASMPGTGLVIYGQKTLQKKASALDRVNVRRLLIELDDKISTMANGVLFEQNTTALRNSFKAQVEAYLSSVAQRNGLYSSTVDLSGNDDDTIDRNEFYCTVGIKPSKAIEFIYLTFTVKSTGSSTSENF